MLRTRVYLGEVPYNDEWYPGKHEPLISAATFEAVQLALGKNAVFVNRRPTKRDELLLSQMVECGGCGHAMHKHEATNKKVAY